MTDNEIIKAFKDFLNEQVDGYTDLVETGGERYEFIEKELELLKETDNLINRQKAEIKKLRYNLEAVLDERADHSEAIKEFAESVDKIVTTRLKYYLEINEEKGVVYIPKFIIEKILEELKETVGDNQ